MKALVLGMFLLGIVSTGHTQIVLKEARVTFDPSSLKIDPDSNSLTLNIPETKVGEFSEDPLMFMKNHFDAGTFADVNKGEEYSTYQVWFNTNKGYMVATIDKRGKLISTSQKFRNMMLPEENRKKILEEHGNVQFVNNTYFATSKGWDINKEYYRVKVKDGKKTKAIRIEIPAKKERLAGL